MNEALSRTEWLALRQHARSVEQDERANDLSSSRPAFEIGVDHQLIRQLFFRVQRLEDLLTEKKK